MVLSVLGSLRLAARSLLRSPGFTITVRRLVLRDVGGLLAPALLLGAGGALAGARLVRGVLFGVEALDPITDVAMAGVLVVGAFGAGLVPALRATRVDPLRGLQAE